MEVDEEAEEDEEEEEEEDDEEEKDLKEAAELMDSIKESEESSRPTTPEDTVTKAKKPPEEVEPAEPVVKEEPEEKEAPVSPAAPTTTTPAAAPKVTVKEEPSADGPEESAEASADQNEVERTTSIDSLTDRERGAFDMLMEMQMRPPEPRERHPSSDSHTMLKDLITRPPMLSSPSIGEEVVPHQLDSGLEQDAVMALLQMHEPSRPVTVPTEFASADIKEEEEEEMETEQSTPIDPEQKKAQLTMLSEHNYFGKPSDKTEGEAGVAAAAAAEDYDSDITDSASEGEQDLIATLPPEIQVDHSYCHPYHPVDQALAKKMRRDKSAALNLPTVANMEPHVTPPRDENYLEDVEIELPEVKITETKEKSKKKKKDRKSKDKKLKDLTNFAVAEIKKEEKVAKPKPTLKPRSLQAEMQVMYDFLIRGIDEEDIGFLKRRYDELLQDDSPSTYWLNDIHWVDHSTTVLPDPSPPKKKRKHSVTEEPFRKHKTGRVVHLLYKINCNN